MIIKENAKGYANGIDHSCIYLSFTFSIVNYDIENRYSLIKLSKEESQRLGFQGREYFECELMLDRNVDYWRMRRYNFEFITDDM